MNLRKRWFAWIYRYADRLQRPFTARIHSDLLGDLTGEVLDVGCGPGTNFQYYPAAARVTAFDYNPHMVQQAQQTLARLPQPHATITVQVADAMALPFPDASFDTYVSTLVLCSVPDLDTAADEAWRILRPGGELRLFEHVRSESRWKARLQRLFSPVWGIVADGCRLDRQTHLVFLAHGFELIEEQRPNLPAEPMPLVILRARKPSEE